MCLFVGVVRAFLYIASSATQERILLARFRCVIGCSACPCEFVCMSSFSTISSATFDVIMLTGAIEL